MTGHEVLANTAERCGDKVQGLLEKIVWTNKRCLRPFCNLCEGRVGLPNEWSLCFSSFMAHANVKYDLPLLLLYVLFESQRNAFPHSSNDSP